MDDMKLNRLNLKIKEHLTNCSKNIELFLSFSEKNKTKDMNKKLEYLKKELDTIQKLIFDPKILSESIFEQIVELELIKIFVSYCALQDESLIILFLPFIQYYLFPNSIITKNDNSDLYELLLMNSSTLNSIKILISTLVKVLRKTETEIIVELSINFLDELLKKFVIFPNFYYSISSSNSNDSEFSFDAELFIFVIEIFSKEYFLIHRETRSKLRKAILICLNLENFYTIKKEYIFNLFDYFVDNLINYYQNYKNFELDNIKKALIKKEGLSIGDMEEIFKFDVISYLCFINIFIRCLEDSGLKFIMKAKIFNKFLVDVIQKDLMNFQKLFNPFLEKKLMKVMEFIFFLTKDYERNMLITFEKDHTIFNDLDFNSIKKNLQKLDIKFSSEKDSVISMSNSKNDKNENENFLQTEKGKNYLYNESFSNKKLKNSQLDISNYDNEIILGFFIKVLKSESIEEMLSFKITLLNILIKIIKNCSGLFLIEILIPFYINYINSNSPKFFDGFLDKLVKYNERFVISEIISILLPKFFTMNFTEWEIYFNSTLQNNYYRNCVLLEKEDILNKKGIFENLENFNSNIFNPENSMIDLNFVKKNYSANVSNDSTFMDNEDILDLYINNHTQNKFSCFLNVSEAKISFYETLINYFKNFTSNTYKENIFLTELFLEIFSVPLISNLGENGNKIYNIYQNITFYSVNKHFLYNISAVGILGFIRNNIDENMRLNLNINQNNYSTNIDLKKEKNMINQQILNTTESSDIKGISHYKKLLSTSLNLNKVKTLINMPKNELKFNQFMDNSNLYIEIFKEFISNLYCKRYFDMINLNNLNQANS